MATWKKVLAMMLKDASPSTYTYQQAATVLQHLGFTLAPHSGGSHRKWRKPAADGAVIVIGLVERGSGSLKPYLVRDMVTQLKAARQIPDDLLDA